VVAIAWPERRAGHLGIRNARTFVRRLETAQYEIGTPKPSQFLSLKPGEQLEVTGVVESILDARPVPGTVPYKDHIVALHLVDIHAHGSEAVILSLEHARQRLDKGGPVEIRRSGSSLGCVRGRMSSPELEKFNRTELDDRGLQLEEPVIGRSPSTDKSFIG
jgi:alginate O-acetyltransferase complex protein AlgJ